MFVRPLTLAIVLVSCGAEVAELETLEASRFDCRAVALPERTNGVPLGCIADPSCDQPMITGHRGTGGGAALYAPENSIEAVRLAILLGIDVVEVDVRETADDRLVLMHDAELERTTGDPRRVAELSAGEVESIPLLAEGFPGDFSCTKVPSFEAVLALAKGRINIDVDTKTARSDLVAMAIRDADMIEQAFVSAGDTDKLVLARATVPEIKLQARPDTLDEYQVLLGALDRPPEIVEVPAGALASFAAASTGGKLFTNVFVQDIVAYAEGDLSVYLEVYDRGADILQTEFPTFVLQALGRGLWASLPEHRRLDIGESPLLR